MSLIFKSCALIFVLFQVNAASFNGPEQCSWLPDQTQTTSKLTVTCRLPYLEETGSNFTQLPAEITSKLHINCFSATSSILPQFNRLHQLEDLKISNCHLPNIPADIFQGLGQLKKLTVNCFNTDSLALNSASLEGLKELQSLDLSANNLRNLPDELLCATPNLGLLNLTANKLHRVDFGQCGAELQQVDLSYNRIMQVGEDFNFGRLRRLLELDLRSNNISDISSDSLSGLVSLRKLDLSHNLIAKLEQNLFDFSVDLKELHLQNNSLFGLPKGLFHRLEQLLVLNLSSNMLSNLHINASTFQGLIRLIILNLSHNSLTRIDSKMFKDLFFLQILDLRNNSIGFIEDDSFLPLYNLHTLNLAENRLNIISDKLFNGLFVLSKLTLNNNLVERIDEKSFQNCSSLKELDLSSNSLEQVPIALQELSFLKTLDLGENQISFFQNGSFKNLNQLTGLRLIDNNIGNISKGMFWDLSSLQVLNLAKNKIQNIERGSFERNTQIEAIRLDENFLTDINGVFATLASLLWLNLSENHLVWFDFAFIPSKLQWLDIHGNFIEHLGNYYKIQEEIQIKTLDASHNRIYEIAPLNIPNTIELLFINNNFIKTIQANTFLDKPNLARVDLYANELTHLDLNALRINLIGNRSLTEVYLGGNPFQCDCSMDWLQLINNLSTSRQYPKIMDLEKIQCKFASVREHSLRMLAHARSSDFLCKYETHCFALCHCCDFDACDCEMTCPENCTCYHDQTWNTNIVDCARRDFASIPEHIPMDATEVYLDGNFIAELENHVFIGRKNMRSLFVNASHVERIQNSTFNGLTMLKILHLEDNKLKELLGYEFEHLISLRELYLSNNLLSYISNDSFNALVALKRLELKSNFLVNYQIWDLQKLPSLTSLSLSDNRWSCRCLFQEKLKNFIKSNALIKDAPLIKCDVNQPLDYNATLKGCTDYYPNSIEYLPLLLLTFCGVVFLLLIIMLAILFREHLSLWIYSKYGLRVCVKASADEQDKLYDAFVCYSPKDEQWVQALAAKLEPQLQLCLQYRDLPPIQHAVLEATEASRRLVLVISRNFVQTEWSRFELRAALHEALKGRVFKLVIVQETSWNEPNLIDDELKMYYKMAEVVKWGEKRFWEKLKYSLPGAAKNSGGSGGGKIINNANYRRNVNNYTIEKQRAPPPAYCQQEIEDANYSSATTATPSPRMVRRELNHRPVSDHIYSSIDSDYSTLERGGSRRGGAPPWRPHLVMQSGGQSGQAYLV